MGNIIKSSLINGNSKHSGTVALSKNSTVIQFKRMLIKLVRFARGENQLKVGNVWDDHFTCGWKLFLGRNKTVKLFHCLTKIVYEIVGVEPIGRYFF